jgi:hypothetical protein
MYHAGMGKGGGGTVGSTVGSVLQRQHVMYHAGFIGAPTCRKIISFREMAKSANAMFFVSRDGLVVDACTRERYTSGG